MDACAEEARVGDGRAQQQGGGGAEKKMGGETQAGGGAKEKSERGRENVHTLFQGGMRARWAHAAAAALKSKKQRRPRFSSPAHTRPYQCRGRREREVLRRQSAAREGQGRRPEGTALVHTRPNAMETHKTHCSLCRSLYLFLSLSRRKAHRALERKAKRQKVAAAGRRGGSELG